MKTYKVDEAIAKFRDCFDNAGLNYEVINSDVNTVRIEVTHEDVSIITWFDATQQLWGFDLLQGGHKSCGKFEEFEDYFGTYLSIHTVFIPNAKIVADAFEREHGINTVYDSFSGNKQKGYTAKFKVLGAGDQNVLVQRIPEGYLVRLVVPDEISNKFKVRSEYKYEITEDGQVVAIPTIHMFMHRLKERYSQDNTKKIQRVGENLFSFSIEDLVITAEISFNYMEVRYRITEVSCYDADFTVSPEDPYDLSAVYMACKDYYDDCAAGEDEGQSVEPSEVETSYPADLDREEAEVLGAEEAAAAAEAGESFDDDFGDEIQDSNEPAEEGQSSGDDWDFGVQAEGVGAEEGPVPESQFAESDEPPEDQNKDTQEPPETPESDGQEGSDSVDIMNVESIKLVVEEGKEVGVQFIVDGKPYIFGVERVKDAGLPVKRIKDSVKIVYKCGMRMTEDELRMKQYADELENPDYVLRQILDAVFA